jgi:hypothetical protein
VFKFSISLGPFTKSFGHCHCSLAQLDIKLSKA